MRTSRGLKLENKAYKLKRSISYISLLNLRPSNLRANFKILKKCQSKLECVNSEMLLIWKKDRSSIAKATPLVRHSLCEQSRAISLFIFL